MVTVKASFISLFECVWLHVLHLGGQLTNTHIMSLEFASTCYATAVAPSLSCKSGAPSDSICRHTKHNT